MRSECITPYTIPESSLMSHRTWVASLQHGRASRKCALANCGTGSCSPRIYVYDALTWGMGPGFQHSTYNYLTEYMHGAFLGSLLRTPYSLCTECRCRNHDTKCPDLDFAPWSAARLSSRFPPDSLHLSGSRRNKIGHPEPRSRLVAGPSSPNFVAARHRSTDR